KKKYIKNLIIEQIQLLDKEVENLISDTNKNELTQRNFNELNWIIWYPWLKPEKEDNGEAKKYEFSSIADSFKLVNLKIKNNEGKLLAFIMLHLRDKQMQIPYIYCLNNEMESAVNAIYYSMLKYRLRTVSIFQPQFASYISKNSSPFFKKRQMKKSFLITEKLKKHLENIEDIQFQDGDGDSAFT
ncbi:MAG: hypothetical protein ABIJ97_01200, partial [Bacteroidota bacterium]